MGVLTDLHYPIAVEQYVEVQNNIESIIEKYNNTELIKMTKKSDDELVKNIRDYFKINDKLSNKQKYCLARWVNKNK